MCVIFVYVNSNPGNNGYKLILASNRDEFYARDTRSVTKWNETNVEIYGGIDLEPGREGGTWLALSEHEGLFKVGALLNLTGEPKPRNAVALKHTLHHHSYQHFSHSLSDHIKVHVSDTDIVNTPILPIHDNHLLLGRGMIVSDFVNSAGSSIDNYTKQLLSDCTKYTAFNFLGIEIGKTADSTSIRLCSNVPPTKEQYCEGKCYGFGNSLPAVPFEKVRIGRERFESIISEFLQNKNEPKQLENNDSHREKKLVNDLQNLLKCEEKCWPDAELKRRAPNWGESLSALNVKMLEEGYGSRTHTIILIDSKDKMLFVEETMATLNPDDEWITTNIEKQF